MAPDSDDFVPATDGSPSATLDDAISKDPIATVRSLVRVMRASSLRRQYFSNVLRALHMKDMQLLRDVDTRWSSTLLMIERAILLREAINQFLEDNEFEDLHKYKLGKTDWEALEAFANILQIPHAFQQVLSFEETPTLGHTFPAYDAMSRAWKVHQSAHPETAGIVAGGLAKLEAYHELAEHVPAYTLAILVDPLQKLEWFYEYRQDKADSARRLFIRELTSYRSRGRSTAAAPPTSAPTEQDRARQVLGIRARRPAQTADRSIQEEVDAYLHDSQPVNDSLTFWRDNRARYPTIFALAMDLLPIQGSSVPCERVFSSSKETVTARRSRLGPKSMRALQILKFAFRKDRGLNFTESLSREQELEELEEAFAASIAVPDDILLFKQSL